MYFEIYVSGPPHMKLDRFRWTIVALRPVERKPKKASHIRPLQDNNVVVHGLPRFRTLTTAFLDNPNSLAMAL